MGDDPFSIPTDAQLAALPGTTPMPDFSGSQSGNPTAVLTDPNANPTATLGPIGTTATGLVSAFSAVSSAINNAAINAQAQKLTLQQMAGQGDLAKAQIQQQIALANKQAAMTSGQQFVSSPGFITMLTIAGLGLMALQFAKK